MNILSQGRRSVFDEITLLARPQAKNHQRAARTTERQDERDEVCLKARDAE